MLLQRFLAALTAAGAIAAADIAVAQWQDENPVIRIGMVTGIDPVATRARTDPFRDYLEERLGVDVEIFLSNDYSALISGELTGRFHAAFLSASAFASANVACNDCLEPVAIPTTPEGEEGFHAVLVVPAGSEITDPAGLPGMRLAVSAEDSVSGRLLPLALFAADGIDIDTIQLAQTDSPAEAVGLMLAGEADAALAWSSLGGDVALGYSRGVLRQLVDEGRLDMNAIAIVWSSPLIPYGPLAIAAELPAELKAALTDAMIEMAGLNPEALVAVNGALGGAFVAASPDLFAPLRLLTDPAR